MTISKELYSILESEELFVSVDNDSLFSFSSALVTPLFLVPLADLLFQV